MNVTPDPKSFNAALCEAIARRAQWMRPINIWLSVDETHLPTGLPLTLSFYASAHTVPSRQPLDEALLELDDTELETLAHMENDPEQWQDYVTELLSRVMNDRKTHN